MEKVFFLLNEQNLGINDIISIEFKTVKRPYNFGNINRLKNISCIKNILYPF